MSSATLFKTNSGDCFHDEYIYQTKVILTSLMLLIIEYSLNELNNILLLSI
jgi:hypothetical protein